MNSSINHCGTKNGLKKMRCSMEKMTTKSQKKLRFWVRDFQSKKKTDKLSTKTNKRQNLQNTQADKSSTNLSILMHNVIKFVGSTMHRMLEDSTNYMYRELVNRKSCT